MRKIPTLFFVSLVAIFAVSAFAASLYNSPSACSGQWTDCNNAFADGTNVSSITAGDTTNRTGIWQDYGFALANNSTVNNVVVRADFFASSENGYINVRVSSDGGASFGPIHQVGGVTNETTFLIDATNDTAWTPAKLNDSNLQVSVRCIKKGIMGPNPTCNLDWLPINVSYTP